MTREIVALSVFVLSSSCSRAFIAARRAASFLALALFVTFIAANSAAAQSSGTGTITGTITDNSQAVIAVCICNRHRYR